MLDGLAHDLTQSLRALRRAPGHAAAVVTTLALGIGATAAIYAVVHAALIGRLPFAEPDRLLLLFEHNPVRNWKQAPASPANLFDWQARATTLDGVAAFADFFDEQVVSGPGEPAPVKAMQIAGDLFGVLGAKPLLGRTPRAEETWAGEERVALLSYAFWQRQLAGDPAVVGKRIEIDRLPVTVIGVMPEEFTLWSPETDLWRPFGWTNEQRNRVSFRRAHYLRPVARLAPGATIAAARAELASIAAALEKEYPETNSAMGVGMEPLRDFLVGDLRRPLLLLFVGVGFVLLVGAANVAHLRIARALTRERDEAVRLCLGASGGRLARRALIESLFLSLIGACAGLALAWVLVPLLVRMGGEELGRIGPISVGPAAAAFALLLAAVTAFASGLGPALRAGNARPEQVLRDGGRAGESARRGRARRILVAAEVALAVVLVAGALLLVRSLRALDRVSPGFSADGVLTARLSLPDLAYPDAAAIAAFERALVERVEALPGVASAALTSKLPATTDGWSSDFAVAGRGVGEVGAEVIHREVSPGYFESLAVPLVAGRGFTADDDADSEPVVLINQTLARRFFPGEDPIGRRICFDSKPGPDSYWRTIVGVVGDERQASLARPARPEFFAPRAQDPNPVPFLVVRSAEDPARLVPVLRAIVRELDLRLPLFEVRTLNTVMAASRARERLVLTLFGGFALLALTLAAIGVYGVAAHAAAGRRREVGIRVALGAAPRAAVAALVRSTALAIGAGALAGLAGAFALGRTMSGLLFEISGSDPVALVAAPLALSLAAACALAIPARRALRVAPAEVLRAE